jgi:hypothetical protein
MVAGLISLIRNVFENTLERSTQPMLKGLFENILSAGVVDVYIVEFIYFGMQVFDIVTTFHIYPPLPTVYRWLT